MGQAQTLCGSVWGTARWLQQEDFQEAWVPERVRCTAGRSPQRPERGPQMGKAIRLSQAQQTQCGILPTP